MKTIVSLRYFVNDCRFFDSLFSKTFIWSVQLICLSTKTPRNFIEDDLFIPYSLIFKTGKRKGKLSVS